MTDKSVLKINYWTVVVAALAAFVMSSRYQSPLLLANVWKAIDPTSNAGMTFWRAWS